MRELISRLREETGCGVGMVKLAKFKEFFGEEWLNQALAEKERADKYEALVRELVYSLKLIRGSSQFSHTTWEEITDLANIALIGAEEVLGDGDHQCQDG